MLLRLLFPSWAFFDAVTDVPRLEVRSWRTGADGGLWRPVLVAPRRGIRHLLYNPEGTEHLALQAVVDRFAVECETGDDYTVTAALLTRMAADAAEAADRWPRVADGAGRDAWSWQWRVCTTYAQSANNSASAFRVLYESDVMASSTNRLRPTTR